MLLRLEVRYRVKFVHSLTDLLPFPLAFILSWLLFGHLGFAISCGWYRFRSYDITACEILQSILQWIHQKMLKQAIKVVLNQCWRSENYDSPHMQLGFRCPTQQLLPSSRLKGVMTWANVTSLVCRFWSLPWTNGPNTQFKWNLRYSPNQCAYLKPSTTCCSNRWRTRIDLEIGN